MIASKSRDSLIAMWSQSRIDRLLKEGREEPFDAGLRDDGTEAVEDLDKIKCAQEFFQSNFLSMFACMLHGLVSLMYVPSVVGILIQTGQSDNPLKAFLRYLSTVNHVLEWYKNPEKRRMSLKKVRALHKNASAMVSRKKKAEKNKQTGIGKTPNERRSSSSFL